MVKGMENRWGWWEMRSLVAVLGSVADDRRRQENSSKCMVETVHKAAPSGADTSLRLLVPQLPHEWTMTWKSGVMEGISFHGAITLVFSLLWVHISTVSSYLLLQVISSAPFLCVCAHDISILWLYLCKNFPAPPQPWQVQKLMERCVTR